MTNSRNTEINEIFELDRNFITFRIDTDTASIKELQNWCNTNKISAYSIIELFEFIAFLREKDAVLFRLTHDNELLERKNE